MDHQHQTLHNLSMLLREVLEKIDTNLPNTVSTISVTNQLISSINDLTTAVKQLCLKLDDVVTPTSMQSKTSLNISNPLPKAQKTFANVLDNGAKWTNYEKSLNSRDTIPARTQDTANENSFIAKLAYLKNQRNEAAYKMHRNRLISQLYEDNVNHTPSRVPRKCVSQVLPREANEMIQHKNNMSRQNVCNLIISMRFHEGVQQRKMEKFNSEALTLIESIKEDASRASILNRYNHILLDSDRRIMEKLSKTIAFLGSTEHMVALAEAASCVPIIDLDMPLSQPRVTNNALISSEPVTLSTVESVNLVKRKQSTSTASSVAVPTKRNTVLPNSNRYSGGIIKKPFNPRPLLNSKNLRVSKAKGRTRVPTQKYLTSQTAT